MAYVAKDWSISALSVELGMDRRTLGKRMAGVEPVRVSGKSKFYRMADVVRALVSAQTVSGDSAFEKSRLDRLRADQIEFDLAIKRSDYAPVSILRYVIGDFASQANSIFNSLPKRLKSAAPFLKAAQIKIVHKELIKVKNAVAEIQVNFNTSADQR